MSSKTPAEQQLEFLKKLKEQQKSGKLNPGAALLVQRRDGSASSTSFRLTKQLKPESKKKRSPALPLSSDAWKRLRDEAIKNGKLRLNKGLGDWAVELLLGMPAEMATLSPELKKELFLKIQDWVQLRSMK
jgi:hypothetical protein